MADEKNKKSRKPNKGEAKPMNQDGRAKTDDPGIRDLSEESLEKVSGGFGGFGGLGGFNPFKARAGRRRQRQPRRRLHDTSTAAPAT
jgi:hypothetical protein